MKKTTYFTLGFIFLFVFTVTAQLTSEGDGEYGRLEGLTYHPTIENRVYANTLKSHILQSDDNGATWEIIYSFSDQNARIRGLEFLGADKLSFFVTLSQRQDNTLYIFDTVSKSISKKYTAPITAEADNEWIKSYDIYEANTDIVILNETYQIGTKPFSVVYYTTDGSATWQTKYLSLSNDDVSVNDVAINPSNPNHIIITRGPGPTAIDGGLFVSTNAGATYNELFVGTEFNEIKFHPTDNDIIYVGSGWSGDTQVFKSTNGGLFWNVEPITWDNNGVIKIVNYIEINPNNTNEMIVLSGDEYAVTKDGGANWINYVFDIDAFTTLYVYGIKASYNPFKTDELLITSGDKYPIKSVNGGQTLTQMKNNSFLSEFVFFNSSRTDNLYYGVQGGIVKKDLSDNSFDESLVIPLGTFSINSRQFFVDENPLNAGKVYLMQGAGVAGSTLKLLIDHGATELRNLQSGLLKSIVDVETNPSNLDEIWVSFDNGTTQIYNTTAADSYIDVTLPLASPTTPGAGAYIHFSTFIDPTDGNHVLIGQQGRIYESFDKGVTWTLKSNGLEVNLHETNDIVYDIQQNPNNANEFVASTSKGIYKTTDFGANWIRVFTATYLRKIAYSTEQPGVIIASVYSSETTEALLLYSVNNGDNWDIVLPSMLANVGSGSMTYRFESNMIHVYLATWDSGVLRYTIDTTTASAPGESINKKAIQIFPNPVDTSFKIILPEGQLAESLEVFNLNGGKVKEVKDINNINMSGLSKGIYLIKVKDTNGNFYIKKMIKK